MGYEIPAGIGVKMAEPEREVVVAIGDGTYLMLNSEIVTAVAEGIRITIVVFDNHGYQCIKDLAWSCGVPQFGNELRFREAGTGPPDRRLHPGGLREARRGDGRARRLRPHRGRDPRRDRRGPRRTTGVTVIHVAVSPGQARPRATRAGGTSRPRRGQRLRTSSTRRASGTSTAVARQRSGAALMRIATALVNWNSPDVPEYRAVAARTGR